MLMLCPARLGGDLLMQTDADDLVGGERLETKWSRPSKPKPKHLTRRLLHPDRMQAVLRSECLDDLIAAPHQVRTVWSFVEKMDAQGLLSLIHSVEGGPGRSAHDPRVLLSLWLFATLQGVGSARELSRLCGEHDAYRWLCGGLKPNYHTLSDFRNQAAQLDDLLTQLVGALMAQGAVTLKRVAADGVRVRANAGRNSFGGQDRLEKCLTQAREQVEALKTQTASERHKTSKRKQAAKERAAREREQRAQAAVDALKQLQQKKREEKRKTEEQIQQQTQASTTDAEARIMKMADGGYRPAFNVQFATDADTQIVTGVDVSNQGTDHGLLTPMLDQHKRRYSRVCNEVLVDGGYCEKSQISAAGQAGVTVYCPPRNSDTRAAGTREKRDDDHLAAWRERMQTDEGKKAYKIRAQSIECVNAHVRNRGLIAFAVRGLIKTRAVALLHALAHNVMRAFTLQVCPAELKMASAL
jgi:transposase